MEVLPSINCPDVECARERLRVLQGVAAWVHLDVADARFTFNKTWGDQLSWPIFGKGFGLEAHLMVEEPEQVIEGWLKAGAKRLIVHIEAVEDAEFRSQPENPLALIQSMQRICVAGGAELMLGINSETAVERLKPYLPFITRFLVLAVYPGSAGQKFLPAALPQIRWIRAKSPDAIIEVDGGIGLETARQVKDAGANVLIAANFLFSEQDVKKRIAILENV